MWKIFWPNAEYCFWLWRKQAAIGDDDRMQPFATVEALFKGRHFDGQINILCVSWYTSFKLSLRDLVIMMADRGITLDAYAATHRGAGNEGDGRTFQQGDGPIEPIISSNRTIGD
jgi:hypothetical protein